MEEIHPYAHRLTCHSDKSSQNVLRLHNEAQFSGSLHMREPKYFFDKIPIHNDL